MTSQNIRAGLLWPYLKDENVYRSCRNLRNLSTTLAHQLHPYELMRCEAVLLTAGALERVKEVFVR